jgi:hypothetical protein
MNSGNCYLKMVKFLRYNHNVFTFGISSETNYKKLIDIELNISSDVSSSVTISDNIKIEILTKCEVGELIEGTFYDLELIPKKKICSNSKVEYKITKITELEDIESFEYQEQDDDIYDKEEIEQLYDLYMDKFLNFTKEFKKIDSYKTVENVNKMYDLLNVIIEKK